MADGTGSICPHGLNNKGLHSKFCADSRVQENLPGEGQRLH